MARNKINTPKKIRKQFTITCEPAGLRIHFRSDNDPNHDLGYAAPDVTLEQVKRYCNTMLGLEEDEVFSFNEVAGIRVYYSQAVECPY